MKVADLLKPTLKFAGKLVVIFLNDVFYKSFKKLLKLK